MLLELLSPNIFGTSEDLFGEVGQLLFFFSECVLFSSALLQLALELLIGNIADKVGEPSAIQNRKEPDEDNSSDSTDTNLCASRHPSDIFNVSAFPSSV